MGYWEIVKGIVHGAGIVLEIVDARFPQKSRNMQLEEMVKRAGKKLVIVINKSDLISKRQAEREKHGIDERCVFVSAKMRSGVKMLRIEIEKLAQGNEAKVAVVGYPNTGKSSVINMLKGRRAARTSSTAGFTRGKQFVRISPRIMLIDSPGVIPLNENDQTLMALLSSKSSHQLLDLEGTGIDVAEYLLREMPEILQAHYNVRASDGEEFLEKMALSRNRLKKGGKPDLNSAARILIDDFQIGAIKPKNREKTPKTT